ncbi:ubiquitin carboxyl-terminal hydrolase 8-like [Centruroides sculpturatus]|uniref:ubiquitin carboxyl-terminal hydrolase 8-like n=1 Tax=Centruroides sculpturatus TaxID=218467 RepID=UPI000C6D88DF|nr:ubiquitin carboxyl-terminal hydrolase 8-like [Centruroides sculpturatus]
MPSSSSVKKLYLAKNLEELNKRAESNLPAVKNSKDILKYSESATKLYKEAVKSDESGDEERAYLLYMRYLAFYKTLRNTYKSKSDMKNIFDLLQKNGALAIGRAEKLQNNLIHRYDNLMTSKSLSNEKTVETLKITDDDKKDDKVLINTQNSIKNDTITDKEINDSVSSLELFDFMEKSGIPLLILDVRSSTEYENSHIKYDSCLNIPKEILKPGITAKAIEKEIPENSIPLWNKRGVVDFVIILDINSSTRNIDIQHPLYTLREAIYKWDNNVILKSCPLILEGGYEDWLLHYPMYTTNPNIVMLGSLNSFPITESKVEIDYPNLDEGFIEMPSTPPTSNDGLEKSNKTISDKTKFSDNSYSTFLIDASKRNVEILDENLDKIHNKTIHVDSVEKPIVNRTLKPSWPLISNKLPETPSIDKTQNTVIPYSILKEEAILEENIKIEKECLDKEKEYELLRFKKLYEAEASMKLEIQKQEEELLAKIKELELEAKAKDLKHQELKKENIQIKQELEKLKEEGKEVKDLQKLQHMEAEKKKLMEDVERLREERKKKERRKQKDNIEQISELTPLSKQINNNLNESITTSEDYTNNADNVITMRISESDKSSRSLSRSHSSPNIAQMVADEEKKSSEISLPKIDRTLKPSRISECFSPTINRNLKPEEISAARLRNLQPVYGNQGRAATGLQNLWNTCFMNAVIQCLSCTVSLSLSWICILLNNHFYKIKFYIFRDKKSSGGVTEEFAIVIRSLWAGVYKSIAPKDFKNTVSKYLSVCVGYEQQDSHEFLIVLLEKLHADLNKSVTISPKQRLNLENLSEFEAQERFWENHTNMNKSIISNLFEGLLQSELLCLNCSKTSNSYEVFSLLSLPIPSTTKCYLKFQFSFDGIWREKLQTYVDFPIELEIPSFIKQKFTKYQLYGVLNHYGTLEGGHYTAYCKNSLYNRWYKYDDHEVYDIYESDIKTSAAYMLFYSSVDFQQCLQN